MRALMLVAGLGLAACGADSSSPPDLAVPVDLAPPGCPPLATYCSSPSTIFHCAPTLADALARDCPDGGVGIGIPPASTADCGPYREVLIVNVDVSAAFYYDATTGALVAVLLNGYDNSTKCGGGPVGFTEPTCQPRVPLCG